MRYFYFNGKKSNDYFWINNISRGYLPPITVPSYKVPNRAGAVALKRNEIDVREIEIDITLWANDNADLRAKTRALADFLIYIEDKPLYFSDEPEMVYYARFNTDSTDLEEIVAIGEGTLNFTCFDPFAYRPYEVNHLNQKINANLVPKPLFGDLTQWSDWYSNLLMTAEEIDSSILRVELVNFELNARMRVLQSTWNRNSLTAGSTYTFSFKVKPSPELTRIEFLQYRHYHPDETYEWVNLEPLWVDVATLPKDDEGYYIYSNTFVSPFTGTARMSMGFGLGNTTTNGSYFRVKDWKVETGSAVTPTTNEPTIFENNGTAETYPRIRIVPYTSVDFLIITNLTTGQFLYYPYPVPAWKTIIFDCSKNIVYYESTGENLNRFLSFDSEFFPFVPGENEIVLENEDDYGVELAGNMRIYWTERFY